MPTGETTARPLQPEPRTEGEEERLRRAVALAAREWQRTLDALETPVLVLELDGRVRRLNRAAVRLLGREFREVLGRRLDELETAEPWLTAARKAAEGGARPAADQCRDGRGRTWEVASRVSREGEEPWIVLTLQDLTERVALEQSVRRNEVMSALGTVVAGVAHEARNPLFGISAALDAFVSRFGSNPEFMPFVEVLRGEVERLRGLVNGLFEYGKRPTRELEPGRLGPVAEEAARACAALARDRGVDMRVHAPEDLPAVLLHRDRLLYVLENLVRNAIQHSPEGAAVELVVERAGERAGSGVCCTVRDRGAGVAPEDLPRLFEPFFSRRRGGTGLGLAVAQRIVEEHGGRIQARNRRGGGSEVAFWLPSVTRSGESEGEVEGAAPDSRGGEG